MSISKAKLDRNISSLYVAQFLEFLHEGFDGRTSRRRWAETQNTDAPYPVLRLCEHGERGAKGARSHCEEQWPARRHSITRSARTRIDRGIVRPRALAVLRLITSSNVLACSTGKSPGLAPLRILSTKTAERRAIASRLGP